MDEIIKIKKAIVELKDIHCQYMPDTNPELWNFDMSLPNSPHVELCELLLHHGNNWKAIHGCRYVQDRLGKGWDVGRIKKRIGDRYHVLMSIHKHGVRSDRLQKSPIILTEEPFWKTRFGCGFPWLKGLELWDGAGRCSAMYALGARATWAVICRDAFPGTKQCKRLEAKIAK